MLNKEDKALLIQKGITENNIEEQLSYFKNGFPFLNLVSSASIQKGIKKLDNVQEWIDKWTEYCNLDKKIIKFVPASGAASRMFKALFGFLEAEYEKPTKEAEKVFFENIQDFAFYNSLDEKCKGNCHKSVDELMERGEYKTILTNLLSENGLNYGNLPKGVLLFHRYKDFVRTPVEEHLAEGSMYAKCNNTVNIHFTVSPEHRHLFDKLIQEKQNIYESILAVNYNISFSEQKQKTDTVAVDMENKLFRENGQLVFRPGGHGALIENLNDMDADIVFIKNIDNVVLDSYKEQDVKYKKTLAGILVDIQRRIFQYLELLDSGKYSPQDLYGILNFTRDVLFIHNPDAGNLENEKLVSYLKNKLNRPIRVCGMVKNAGEPGGGPFLTVNQDGTSSPQILESSQIDMNDPEKKAMFESGTHFNPVDLVCAVRDYKGNKFNLKKYVDKDTGFISVKSKNGRDLKALELPGLWNGAMSDWNTIFVEVPIETFNPVKVVNDLLRKQHFGK